MSKPPSYSETFFNSKIIGLKKRGFDVILFVQQNDSLFKLCETRIAPKVYKKNVLLQFFEYVKVIIQLLWIPKRLHRFMNLERKANRSWKQLLKNVYNNSHILTSHVDWLHFGFATMALQSEHVAKAIDAKMAISLRGFDIAIYPLQHLNCYDLLWKNVDKVHTISDDLLNLAYANGLGKEVHVGKITPAVDITKFERTSIDFNRKHWRIATAARLHWKKGIVSTLEALAILNNGGLDFEYTIVGEGSEIQDIKFAIHQLGLIDRVKLVGKKTHADVITILSSSDIYLQFSISEGFCNAVLEAQAMGLLCIVSDAEGLSENVLDNETGWVVNKRNAEALANKILEVVNLPIHEKEMMVQRAIKRVKEDFNLEKQQDAFLKFYE
ncbi:MAG: colanic acid/amylovoran biosynthesis glycosyltransferase [Flavobacteriaceae bacterium]|jgi:colanic acid/amylovoran biosynthesis glycosyltransferase